MRNEVLITTKGDNEDVLSVVNSVFTEYRDTCSSLVVNLHNIDFADQCASLFDYVIENVRYIEDPGNNQYVKVPKRTLMDGYADCKSMAILIASCLWCLNCPEIRLRFVSFDNMKVYSHVYVVASNGQETIILDPVERVNGQPVFDYARPYNNKYDYIYKR